MTTRKYATAEAFKQALEQRLRHVSPTGIGLARRRQLLVFDRFLARIVQIIGDAATLKGGLVLEIRLKKARSTKDVDLRFLGSPDDTLARQAPYAEIAQGDGVPWATLADVVEAVRTFLDPLLVGGHAGTWDPLEWSWK